MNEPGTFIFKIGEIVTFKSHPLLYDYDIKGDGKYTPPLMIVKEILFENNQKRTHDEISGLKIAEKIKYICVYFDDNKSEFVEVHLYESMLSNISKLHIGRIDKGENLYRNHTNLVDEVLSYPTKPSYEYGKIIYFKTKKLEVLKKRSSKKITINNTSKEVRISTDNEKPIEEKTIIQYVVNYTTPDFVISGYKQESYTDLFYNNGKRKRLVSANLVKIQWYNPIKQKFSEHLLPIECFTDKQPFDTKIPHNITHLHKPEPAVEGVELPEQF